MPKSVFRFIVTLLTLIILVCLASCGGTPSATGPESSSTTQVTTTGLTTVASTPAPSESPAETPAAPVVTTTTEIVIVEAPTETATLSVTSTTTTTATSTAPPGPPANAADLKPFPADGKSVIVADTSSKDYREFKIKASITNAGQSSATSVTVNLNNTGNKVFTWNIPAIAAGENIILETTVGDILKQSAFTPGMKSLNIDVSVADSSQEIGGNNKSAEQEITIAPEPAAIRQSQSTTEKLIQDSIDNSTWYTDSNKADLLTIAKDILKKVSISWSLVHIELKPFDAFNKFFSDSFGETDQQKAEFKAYLEKNKLTSFSFVYGTTGDPQICIREGTLVQVLPIIFAELGTLTYSQANYPGYSKGYETGSSPLVEVLMKAYAFSIMRDDYGFGGLTNMSASIGSIPDSNLQNNMTIKRLWALSSGTGYYNGDVPSADLLKMLNSLLGNQDPAKYIKNLDEKVADMDTSAVTNTIRWRLVNKDVTDLPKDVVTKIDPGKSSVSLDSLISYQDFVVLPW
jgi:hypothetical protein